MASSSFVLHVVYMVRCSIQDHTTTPGKAGWHYCPQSMLVFLPSPIPPFLVMAFNALSVHRTCNCSSCSGSFAQGEDICILDSCKKCELGLFLD